MATGMATGMGLEQGDLECLNWNGQNIEMAKLDWLLSVTDCLG
jgi:hypothetical protein